MNKKLTIILGVFCAVILTAQSQQPQRIDMWQFGGVNLTSIATQGESAIVCGDQGTIVITDPDVLKWRRVFNTEAGDSTILNRVEYVAQNVAVAVGTMGCIIRTTDNGATWRRVASGTFENLTSIAVVRPDRVICVGTGGTALVSIDQGRTWAEQTVPKSVSFNDVCALSDGTVIGVGPLGMVATLMPSSNVWSVRIGTTDRTLASCWFRDRQYGFAGAAREILVTTDGGASWSRSTMINNGTITRLQRVGDRLAGVGSYDGMVYLSNFSLWGTSYWMTDSITVRGIAAVPSAPNLMYVIGEDGVIRSFDLTKPVLNDVGAYRAPFYFDQIRASDGTQWFVGSRGAIHLLRSNGTWEKVRDQDALVSAVGRIDQANMTFIATYTGKVEWKFDGDTTWYRTTIPGNGPKAVRAFSAAGDMWLVDGNRVLRAADPDVWAEVHVEPGVDLYDVDNYTPRQAAVCGSGGTVLYSVNSGATWTRSTTGVDAVLMDLDLNAEGNGYAVGERGTILKTSNGGASFETVAGPRSQALLTSVDHDPTTGLVVIVAADGSIFIRPTATSRWQHIMTYTQLQSVLIANGAITAAGEGGTIYQIPLSAVSVAESDIPQLQVAPNPATTEMEVIIGTPPPGCRLDVVSVSGRTISSIKLRDGVDRVIVDLRSAASGSYYIQLFDINGSQIGRAHVVK